MQTPQERIASWPHRWFGLFRNHDEVPNQFPLISEYQMANWCPEERSLIVKYLNDAPNVIATSAGDRSCQLCDVRLPKVSFHSDGKWLWPKGLSHLVEMHRVILPDLFLEWIRVNNYTSPSHFTGPIESLSWPDV